MAETQMSWDTVMPALRKWHESRDRVIGRAVFAFIEGELRLVIGGLIRQQWSKDLVEDGLQSTLEKLAEKPLPDGISEPRRYLTRALRNRCIDLYRARRRRGDRSLDDAPAGWEPPTECTTLPAEIALRHEREQQIHNAIEKLDVSDRVVLKLREAPEWLTDEELDWLAKRSGLSTSDLQRAIVAAEDKHALTLIFDPGDDDPDDSALRRKRMERFRRRRARAREKLHKLLQESC